MSTGLMQARAEDRQQSPRAGWRPGASGTYERRLLACRLAVPAAILVAWTVLAGISDLVPSVGSTLAALAAGFVDGWIIDSTLDTLGASGLGFLGAVAVGLPMGLALGRWRFAGRIFEPIVSGIFAIPRIILYPVLLAAFGVGLDSKVWFVVISACFPIALNASAAVRSVSPILVKLGRSLSCSSFQMFSRIYVPAVSPALMVGIRLGLSISFISVLMAELFAATSGLGLLIQQSYGLQQYPKMFAVVLLTTLIAFGGNLLLMELERRVRSASE